MKLISKKFLMVSFLFLNSFIVTTSFAQQGGSTDGADKLVGGYGNDHLQVTSSPDKGGNLSLFFQSPSYSNNLLASFYYSYLSKQLGTNISLPITEPNMPPNVPQTLTDNGVFTVITATNSKLQNLLSSSLSLANSIYLDNSNKLYFLSGTQAKTQDAKGAPNVADLNIDSLINPAMYTSQTVNNQTVDQQENALQFINNLANQYNPLPVIDFSTLNPDQLNTAFQNQQVLQYIFTIRNLAASYSVGMSNLAYLYSQRVPQKTKVLLGTTTTNVPLPPQYQTNISPLAYDQWAAMRRLMPDPNNVKNVWFTQMESATPATLQRESVYLLAEIRQELFQNRMTQERILATLSAIELQNAGSNNLQINTLRNSICTTTLKGTTACPPMVIPGGAGS